MEENLKSLFDQFIAQYDEQSMKSIWESHNRKFMDFWRNRIMDKQSSPITDNEIDSIIQILDRNAKGNTKADVVVAKALIPQLKWRKMFHNIRDNMPHSTLINQIINESNSEKRIKLLDELYKINDGWKNHLTGRSANGINCILAVSDPFGTLSIISLNDRQLLMTHLGYPDINKFNELSWGAKIIESGRFILEEFRKSGVQGNARLISDFVYSPIFKNKWRPINIKSDTSFEQEEKLFKERLSNFKEEEVEVFFNIVDEAIEVYDLSKNDKLTFSISNDQLSFHVGKRYCLVLKGDEFSFIAPLEFMVNGKESVHFKGPEDASYQKGYKQNEVIQYTDVIIESIGKEIDRGVKPAGALSHDNAAFRKAAFDDEYRGALLSSLRIRNIDGMGNKADQMSSLNTILFGPPGTGKTYRTVEFAVEIISGPKASNEDRLRKEVKNEYERLVNDKRIVFTTVHQSLGYEDFIEGIKPVMYDGQKDGISYKIESGIFKTACANAAYLCYQTYLNKQPGATNYTFDELYDAFIEDLRGKLENDIQPIFKTIQGRDVGVKDINKNDSIIARAANSIAKASAPLTKENLQKLYDKFKTLEEIKDLGQVRETVEVTPRLTEFYAVFNGLKEFEKKYSGQISANPSEEDSGMVNQEEILRKFESGVFDEAVIKFHESAPKMVLILDEINRGNVSQIFGELITLLEDDKRWGNNMERLSVVLPYSKSRFYVPANLYVLGTMNTADRSVEALDTALRRRFSFVEMTPKYDISKLSREVDGVKLSELLAALNSRIEKLRDRDHLIGHSYFLSEKINLREVFQNKIIPLLQEYFYGDYGKIGLVLGKGFVTVVRGSNAKELFAAFDYDDSADDLAERPVYQLKAPMKMTEEEFKSALQQLMNNQ